MSNKGKTVWRCNGCEENPCTLNMIYATTEPRKCPFDLRLHIAKWEAVKKKDTPQ